MKTVYSNSMVAHVWAQQSQSYGRSNNGQFYFQDSTIYSYGSHFPIARFVTHKGKTAVLYTTKSYRMTTAKHKNHVWQAIIDQRIFCVPDVMALDHRANCKAMQDKINKRAASFIRKHRSSGVSHELCEIVEQVKRANAYAEFFGLKWRAVEPVITAEQIAVVKEYNRVWDARQEAKNAERKRVAMLRDSERLAEWLAGGNVGSLHNLLITYLRVRDDELQTSRGASVPLEHAIKAFRLIKACKDAGKTWHRNGQQIRVGHFEVDAINIDGSIKAGCHTITWPEIERIARQVGLFDEVI